MYAPFPADDAVRHPEAVYRSLRSASIPLCGDRSGTERRPATRSAGPGDRHGTPSTRRSTRRGSSISDPLTGARVKVPPGGHCSASTRAPTPSAACSRRRPTRSSAARSTSSFDINDGTQDVLNPRGVNAIRAFPARGIRVWGARTLSRTALWKYVIVRRLFIFLERSIYEGTQWVVFEPNDDRLWARVKDTVRLFLRTQWRDGALFGRTEEEAFFITCDRTTMTQDDILNGRLICEIGIAPVRPAEFVIFRIFQNTAEAQR